MTADLIVATGNDRAVVGNGKVPSASPTGMFSLDSRVRGNDGAVVVGAVATDNNRAAVAGTVATVGDSTDDGAVADDTVIDGTTTDTGTVKNKTSIPDLIRYPEQIIRRSRPNLTPSPTADAGDDNRNSQLPSMDDWIPASCRNDKP